MAGKEQEAEQREGISYSPFIEEDICRKSQCCACCRRCCFKGYFWCFVGALYFFVIFPAGILLVIHGSHRGVLLTLCLGSLELVLFGCLVPSAYVGLRQWHRRRVKLARQKRESQRALKEKAAFVNNAESVATSPVEV